MAKNSNTRPARIVIDYTDGSRAILDEISSVSFERDAHIFPIDGFDQPSEDTTVRAVGRLRVVNTWKCSWCAYVIEDENENFCPICGWRKGDYEQE